MHNSLPNRNGLPENTGRRGLLLGVISGLSGSAIGIVSWDKEITLGKFTSVGSRFVEQKFAKDETEGDTMIDSYELLIREEEKDDQVVDSWYLMSREYNHDPVKVFGFFLRENYFTIREEGPLYKEFYGKHLKQSK